MSRTQSGYDGEDDPLTREELAAAARRVGRPIAATRLTGSLWELEEILARRAGGGPGSEPRPSREDPRARTLRLMARSGGQRGTRLPWRRGPAAFAVAQRASEILAALAGQRRRHLSLRATARVLGVSTQPVRDWVRDGHLCRVGPRGRFTRQEVEDFVQWLAAEAEPFPWQQRAARFRRGRGEPSREERRPTLELASFVWPARQPALTPGQLADLIGCHPSLIVKAIRASQGRLGRRRSPHRWEITRRQWRATFWFSQTTAPGLAPLPRQAWFSTAEAADVFRRWGCAGTTSVRVRRWIQSGVLQAAPSPAGQLRWRVLRKSLEQWRKKFLTQLRERWSARNPRRPPAGCRPRRGGRMPEITFL
jgi:hypothetical protein